VISLDYRPRDWQKECHLKRKRFTVLALHRRAGKTELAIMELVDKAMRFTKELGLFVYISPFLKQSKAIAWHRLKQRLEPLRTNGIIDVNETESSVTFKHNGAQIKIYGADSPDALRGIRADGAVIDEVAQVKPEMWNDVLQPALSDRKGWAMFIGTPDGINLFSELFYRAADLPDWHAAKYTVYDTGSLDMEEVERLKRDMSDSSFAREFLCDFSAAGDDQLISLADVDLAAKRLYTEKDVEDAPKILGVDPARFGDDRSVIMKRTGLQAYKPISYRGIDNMELAARVVDVIDDWQPDAVFVDAGAGAGVIDRLRQLGHDVIEVPFGGKAIHADKYINRRCEMWFGMREWIHSGGAIPDDISLKQELATPIFWYDGAGRKVLESKAEIKKRLQGGASPDIADALALTFAHPVGKKPIYEQLGLPVRKKNHDYNPYDRMEK
jgi:hypothetical protein